MGARFDYNSCSSIPFVSNYTLGKIQFFSLECHRSTHRHSYCFLSEKLAAITVRCVSESHGGEEMEGLTAEVFGEILRLSRRLVVP